MTCDKLPARLIPIALALGVAACGGGGTGTVNSTPTAPLPSPSPSPSSSPSPAPTPPPLPNGAVGLQSTPLKTFSARTDGWGTIVTEKDAVEISYSQAEGRYTVKLPGYQQGLLVPKTGNGSFGPNGWIELNSTNSDLTAGSGSATQPVTVTIDWPASSKYRYTSFGRWSGPLPMGHNDGVFAYGTPTASTNVPLTGQASYQGEIRGLTNGEPATPNGSVGPVLDVFGTVALTFDFGAGTLLGQMNPEIAPVWDAVSLGAYTFRNTIYSTGSTTFSGAFNVPNSTAPSSFSGTFTGPQATELMADWRAPYKDPGTGVWGTMSGVWVAKTGN